MLRFLTAITLSTLFAASTASAADKIYRWTDANGQTHFSSQPPAGQQDSAKEYTPRYTRPAEDAQGYRIDTESYRKQKTAAAERQQEEAAKAAEKPSISKQERADMCRKAREYKQALSANFSRRFQQEDGEYRPLTDEQRAEKLENANKMISDYCQ